jgi:hypothetical protein
VLAPDGAEVEAEQRSTEGFDCEPLARQPFDMVPASNEQAAQQQ